MKRLLFFGFAMVAALILGAGSAWLAIGTGMSGGIQIGAWRHYPGYGSPIANPYVRAQTQIAGPLALDRSEAIYFIADRDNEGEPLRAEYDYRIEGRDLEARWWSITAYGDDHHLIANSVGRYSYNSANVARNADRSWTIHLSRTPKRGNWIPTGDSHSVELFLRVYNPAPVVLENVGSLNVPRIIRER